MASVVSCLPARRRARARTAAAGSCRPRMPVAPIGVVCSVRPTAHTTEPVGASSTCPSARDEHRVVGAAAGRLALRGHVHRVRQRLDAAEQPRRVGERVGGVAAVEHDDPDALARAVAGSRPIHRSDASGSRWVAPSAPAGQHQLHRRLARRRSSAAQACATSSRHAASSNAISSAAAERVIRARCASSLSTLLAPPGRCSTRQPSKQPSPRVTPGSSARTTGVAGSTSPRPSTASTDLPSRRQRYLRWGRERTPSRAGHRRPTWPRDCTRAVCGSRRSASGCSTPCATSGHATPEQISEAVPEVDLTTVYRTLELLEELGLVRHTHLDHGAPSYRPAEDDHVHVVCHDCGAVVDAPADARRRRSSAGCATSAGSGSTGPTSPSSAAVPAVPIRQRNKRAATGAMTPT